MANGTIEPNRSVDGSGGSGTPPATPIDRDILDRVVISLEERVNKKFDNLESKSEDRQIRSIEVLGIFMAFLSFIAVNVQIFNRVSSAWSAGLFVLLMFCSLAILIVLMDIFLKGGIDIDKKKKGFFDRGKDLVKDYRIMIIFIFLAVGMVSILALRNFSLNPVPGTVEFDDIVSKKINERIDKKLEHIYTKEQVDATQSSSSIKIETQIDELKNCLKSGGWNTCLETK